MSRSLDAFETQLTRRVREEIRKVPAIADEYQRQRKARRFSIWVIVLASIAALIGLIMVAVVIPGVLLWNIASHFGPDFLLGTAGLAFTVATLAFAEALLKLLKSCRVVTVASHLPEADADIAGRIWAETAGWFCLSAYLALYANGIAAFQLGLNAVGWTLALSLGVVQTMVLIGLGTLLAVNRPRWSFAELAGAIGILLMGIYVGCAWIGPGPAVAAVSRTLYRVTPAGWVNAALGLGYVRGELTAWFGLAAAGIIVALLYPAVKYLRANYHVESFEVEANERATANIIGPLTREYADVTEGDTGAKESIEKLDLIYSGRSTDTDIDAETRAARIAEQLQPRSNSELGPIERIVYRFLSPREREISEFLAAETTMWSRLLKGAGVALLWALPITWIFQMDGAMFMVAIGLGITCLVGPWRGMFRRNAGGIYVAMWSVYPLEYREMFRTLYKIGAIRCVLTLPLAVCGLAVPLTMNKLPITWLLLAGPIWLAAMLVFQNWTVSWNLSGFFSFPSFRWRRLPIYFPPLFAVLCQLFGTISIVTGVGIGRPLGPWVWGGVLATNFGSFLIRYYYNQLHRRGLLDPVALTLSKEEEQRVNQADGYTMMQIRKQIARDHHGRLWWRNRAVRKWVRTGV